MQEELQEYFGHIFDQEILDEINQVGTFKDVEKGSYLIDFGQYIKSMPLLVEGVVKVMRQDDEGFELLLYYIERGETCSMTLNCCLNETKSEVRAVAEKDTRVVMIPVQKMEEWMTKYRSWRNFVLTSYHNRMIELLDTIDTIAFKKMDERLLDYLRDKQKFSDSNIIKGTHNQIAIDLHSSRVVVSRLLKSLEKQGNIILHRNSIEIIHI
ncbi:MAG: Crp/Fnr family transcriptional regulator [Bacteroidota bacterium]